MVNQNKTVVPGKVQKNSNKKYKIKKKDDEQGKTNNEVDIEIEIEEDGEFDVDKLSTDGLEDLKYENRSIRWFNNFSIKKNGQYINQKFKVKIDNLSTLLAENNSVLVIFDGNGDPYKYTGTITDDTFELTDGDPATGRAP